MLTMCSERARVGRSANDNPVMGECEGAIAGGAPERSDAARAGKRPARVHLASRSPRRRELLTRAGIAHEASHPGLDDGELEPGQVRPDQWVTALAYLKAASALKNAAGTAAPLGAPVVLGADTVVVLEGRIIGQPRDEGHARQMLTELRDAEHDVITGVALLDASGKKRLLFSDRASVRVGHIDDAEIDTYIRSGEWRGKAGAYNLDERIAAGWPITFEGDPGTVMGLPVRALVRRLAEFEGQMG